MNYKEIHFKEIDSTNKYAKEHSFELDNFTIVSSDFQSAGKGRNDHIWLAQKGDNLLFSLFINDLTLVKEFKSLSLISAYIVASFLEKEYGLATSIKWPNDVYVNDKKICGILLEGDINNYLVLGIGINVNQKEFAGDYARTPTSLYLETKKVIKLNEIKERLFNYFIASISNFAETKAKAQKYIQNHNFLYRKSVTFDFNNREYIGVVEGINENFELEIKTNDDIVSIYSGEIKLI